MKAIVFSLFLLGLAGAQSASTTAFGYLGPVGTYSDQVAQAVAHAHGWTPTLATSITDVATRVQTGEIPFGLIPIENSSGGFVAETVTILNKTPTWRVIEIDDLPIDNTLLVNPGTKLSDITTIISHPQPFLQSAGYLKTNFPNVKRVEAKSTAAAAEQVAALAGKDGGTTTAAIAAPGAADVYHLQAIAQRIQDDKGNTTRFLVVQHAELSDTTHGKHAIVQVQGTNSETVSALIGAMRASGMTLAEAFSTPAGTLGHQNTTLFFDGERPQSAAMLRRLITAQIPSATLVGLYNDAIQVK